MNVRRPLPEPLARAPFTTSEASSAGLPRSRLRAADVVAPFHGTRAPVAESIDLTVDARCSTLQTRMRDHQFFSHATAALLCDLPIPDPLRRTSPIHVTSLAPHPPMRRTGVAGHQVAIPEASITSLNGLRVPVPPELWCELGSQLGVDDLVVFGDALVRRRRPLCTLDDLRQATESARGRPGRPQLERALRWVRPGVDSPMESRLRLILRDAALPEPEVNGTIVDSSGEFVARGDLVYPEHRVVVEYDGGHHRTIEKQYHRDIDREYAIRATGWEMIRVNKTHLRNRAAVAVARVTAALDSRFVRSG